MSLKKQYVCDKMPMTLPQKLKMFCLIFITILIVQRAGNGNDNRDLLSRRE